MKATNHATKRWAQRFPRLNMAAEYSASQPLGSRRKRKLGIEPYRSARITASGIVFVVDGGWIITVMRAA